MSREKTIGAIYKLGLFDSRIECIDLVMRGTRNPMQTATLKALQRDRRRIAMMIAGNNKDLRGLVDSYTMASEECK
jgi:hypothetical protein